MRHILLIVLLAVPCLLFSQNVTLSGKIIDSQKLPVEAATVYLNSAKDSTLIDYTITDKNGQWHLKTKSLKTAATLKVSFVGLKTYAKKLDAITADVDFGTVTLEDNAKVLGEVVVEGEIPPIRVKKDTLEFNAASFNVKADANLQELLKQLPGLEIAADGKMTINGKEVNQILVNGKPFFDKDGKVALQNLPAEIINKIQVTSTKSKEEELSGQKATGNNASINVTIDEDKNKGMFGRGTVGFGTSGRYENSLLANYFKGDRKVSVLASSNNINTIGFSMDEIFDNMSGGRNQSMWSNGSSFNINGMQFGGDTGITRSNIFGLNYADKWVKGFDGGGSYFYSDGKTDNTNRSTETNFVTKENESDEDLSYVNKNENVSRAYRYSHNYNTNFSIAADSTLSIYFEPKFVRGYSRNNTQAQQTVNRLTSGLLLTDTRGEYANETDNKSFSNMLVVNKSFRKDKSSGVSLDVRNENTLADGYVLNNTATDSYDYTGGTPTVSQIGRNILRRNRQKKDEYIAEAKAYTKLKDSIALSVSMVYNNVRNTENRRGFNYNGTDADYTSFNDAMSGFLRGSEQRFSPRIGIGRETSKMWANVEGGMRFIDFKADGVYTGTVTAINKDYLRPYAVAQLSYHLTKTKSIWASYNYDVILPQASQLLPVQDIFNQLSSNTGYLDLKPTETHNVYLNFNDFDYASRSGYSFYGGFNYNTRAIVGYSEINNNAISQNSYRNVTDTYNSWFGGYWSKSFKKEAHSFKLNMGLYGGYSADKGYLNTKPYEGKSLSLSPNVNVTYKYGELLTVNPFYEFDMNKTNYTNYAVSSASSSIHKLGINTTSYWPKHIVMGHDLAYSYNPQQASFRKQYYLWNASIGYSFWKDQLTFKTKVYDLLNQNQGITRTVSARSISEQENTVLKRYVMFSLSIKLDKFAGKKQAAEGSVISF